MRLGPYELVRMVGAGGMGEVWAAHRAATGPREILAVKRLPERLAADPTYRQILLDEARLSMLLRHRNIINVFDAGEVEGGAYIAMEFIHGLDLSRLRKLLDQTGELISPTISAYVIGEILEGLAYAHDLIHEGELISLVHRDVSPHNVILSTRGEVKLTDYGVARLSSEDTSGTHVKGKARYMPPEQLRGESRKPTVDLFAAGAVLQEMLDGQIFRGEAIDDARLLGMAIDGVVPPPLRPHAIPRELEILRQRLLDPDPETRVSTANEALALLRRWPGYRGAAAALGEIVQRYLELQASLGPQQGETGLAHQATFLQTNAALALGASDSDNILDSLLNPSSDDLRSTTDSFGDQFGEPTAGTVGRPDELGHTLATDDTGPASTGAHDQLDELGQLDELDELEGPPGSSTSGGGPPRVEAESDLVLDSPEHFVRHVPSPTRPNPTLGTSSARRSARYIGLGLGLVGLGLGLWWGLDWLRERPPAPGQVDDPSPPSGMSKVRVIGDDFAGYAGFRQHHMERLVSRDILYDYIEAHDSADAQSPLAALAANEAEFVLTTLDQVLLERARRDPTGRAPDKIVAIVDVSLGGDALVLDSKERRSLRSLAELTKLAAKAEAKSGPAPVLAYTGHTPSEYLDLHLNTLLSGLDGPALAHVGSYESVSEVYDALGADADPEAPVVAALLWEPWVSKAVAEGMSVAVSTRDLPHAIVDVLVARAELLADDAELVETVVGTYYAGIVAQPPPRAELIARVAADVGLSEDEAASALDGLCLLDAIGAEPWLVATNDGRAPLLATAVEASWATLRSNGRVDGPAPALSELVDARAVIAAAQRDRETATNTLDACLTALTAEGPLNQALGALAMPGASAPWFLPGDDTLASEHASAAAELATRLRAFNPATVAAEITGYGDDRGAKSKALGLARANTLIDTLIRHGVGLQLSARGAAGVDAPTALVSVNLARAR